MSLALRLRELMLALARKLEWLPPLVARFTLGYVFVESGWGKLHSLPRVIEYFASLGIPAPEIQAPFAAATELVAGALILAGLLSRLAAVPLVVIMLVAIRTARWEELAGVSDLLGFIEYLYIALALYVAVHGPGALSLDALLLKLLAKKDGPAAAPVGAPAGSRA